jgi:hypothetical protein
LVSRTWVRVNGGWAWAFAHDQKFRVNGDWMSAQARMVTHVTAVVW